MTWIVNVNLGRIVKVDNLTRGWLVVAVVVFSGWVALAIAVLIKM